MKKIIIATVLMLMILPLLGNLIGFPKTNIAQLMTGPD